MTLEKRPKLTDQEMRNLVSVQEHPGWRAFEKHLKEKIDDANKLSVIPNKGEDAEILFMVRLAQARVSIYNGLIGFMNEVKIKAKLKQEENNG